MTRNARSIVLQAPATSGVARIATELALPPEFTDRFALEAELGRGASGVVLRAQDLNLARSVAIKFLFEAANETERARFLREAQALSKVAHPHVVTLYDFDLIASHPYLVLELVDGGSLRGLLRESGRLAPAFAVGLVVKVLEGLAVCHDAGIVHRDVKPENVLLTRAREPKLADLGVARAQADTTRLTSDGGVVGTLHYMAPEQFRPGDVTAAADLHAAGAMLHELLTGHLPYSADTPGLLVYQVINNPPPDVRARVPELPAPLAQAVQRALAKDPAARPPTARQLAHELTAALQPARRSRKSPVRPSGEIARPARRVHTPHLIAAVLCAGGLVGALLVRALRPSSRPEREPSSAAAASSRPERDPAASASLPGAAVASVWCEPALLELEARLNDLSAHEAAHWKLFRAILNEFTTRPDRKNFGRLKGPLELLSQALAADALLVDVVVRGLAHRVGRRAPTPLEVVLTARAAIRQFALEALRERLTVVARYMPTTAGLVAANPEFGLMLDIDPAPPEIANRFVRACQQVPHAVTAAIAGGVAAGPRFGDVIDELSFALGWLRMLAGATQSLPTVVQARDRLLQALAADGADLMSTAHRIARAAVELRGVRPARRTALARLDALAPDIARVSRDLPANREPLERWAAMVRRSFDEGSMSLATGQEKTPAPSARSGGPK